MRRPLGRPASVLRFAITALVLLFLSLSAKRASAYPWMIRHDYAGCAQCHVDPDGAGLLTEYGRAQGETLLRTHYGNGAADEEPGKVKDFLWGLVKTPDWLLLGGSFRPAVLVVHVPGTTPSTSLSTLLMEGDLRAGIQAGGFRASASAGVISTDVSRASISGPVVSREHWLGYSWDDDQFMVRAGRMNLPFGIRSIEHPLWVRATTRTDINDAQQHGVSFDYVGGSFRGSLMGILGNYQIAPDAYRERGYVGFLEWAAAQRVAIGVSSLVTHAAKDLDLGVPDTRQAHGIYFRASPHPILVLTGEGDFIVNTTTPSTASSHGFASMLQADVEPVQGVHLIATGETLSPGGVAPQSSFGGWGSVHWFFAPHADVRFDFVYRAMANGGAPAGTPGGGLASTTIPVTTYLVQLHAYL